jgi:phosphohistidine phosphatase
VSPAHRARTTWELASAELDRQPGTRVDDRVYGASVSDLLEVVRDLPDDARTVVLVGHNPGFEDLSSLLTNEAVSMPTSAVAVLEMDGGWSSAGESRASLRASGRPPA